MADFSSTISNLGLTQYGASTTSTGGVINKTDTSKLGNPAMDQSSFLTLMTAQLKNQDPFEPVDNTQMVAQMAQFSSLSGISEMNATLKALSAKLTGTSLNEAIGYVGKNVLVPGTTAYPRTSGGLAGAVALAKDANQVTVSISNAKGEILRTIDLGKQSSGAVAWEWDGTTNSGEPAGEGPFTVKAVANDGKGMVDSQPLVWAPVSTVSLGADGQPALQLPGIGSVSISDVWQVG